VPGWRKPLNANPLGGGELELHDELLTVAELAIGIAGFAAVVTAFSTRGRLHPHDIARFRTLIVNAGVAAILGFVPSLLLAMGYSDTSLWRAASLVMIAFAVLSWVGSSLQARGVPTSVATLPILSLGVLNLLLQAANSSGLIWRPSGAAYLAGTLVWLAATVAIFVVIVVDRPAA